MIVYIQKKIKGKWRTILPVNEERVHKVCNHLIKHNPFAEYRIITNYPTR